VRTAKSYFIADFRKSHNYPATLGWSERHLVHEAAWEALPAADRSPYEAREAADLLRYNQEVAESARYKGALLASDPSTTSATRYLLLDLTSAIGHHGLTKTYRGVKDSFAVREASSLVSLPSDLEGGEGALLMVNATTRLGSTNLRNYTNRWSSAACMRIT